MDNSSNYVLYLQNLLTQHHIPFLSPQEVTQTSLKQDAQPFSPHQRALSPTLKTNIRHPFTGPLIQRYSRQMLLKEISYEGQLKIVQSKIAIIGAGGIGCPLALYLAAAGTGTIGLFDSDTVEITNLHRQVGHRTDRLGMPKTKSLKQTLLGINPHINIQQHAFITVQTVHSLDDYDFIIDGSDNPKCRYIVNDYCMKRGKKLLSGACIGWEAQITCYGGDNLCYRCLWGNQQVSLGGCSTLGVVGMIPGIVGLLLATQALKMVLTGQSSLEGKLLTYDGRTSEFKKISLRKKKPECIGCGENKLDIKTYNYQMYNTCSAASVVEGVQQVTWPVFLTSQLQKQRILDVRPTSLFNIVHFQGSNNVPLETLKKMNRDQILELLNQKQDSIIPVTCARGITSKAAAFYLGKLGLKAVSISGGLQGYQRDIDSTIPIL